MQSNEWSCSPATSNTSWWNRGNSESFKFYQKNILIIQNIERHEQPQGSHYIKQEPEFLPSSDNHVIGGDDLYSGNSFHSKHVCKVCGDRASGKHYGLYSCEGCKVRIFLLFFFLKLGVKKWTFLWNFYRIFLLI